MIKEFKKDIYYLNFNNHQQRIFEGEIPLSKGMSYNAYIINDNKTALLDTCDASVIDQFVVDVKKVLNDKPLDYFIIHHLEPDHTAGIEAILKQYPNVNIVISNMGFVFLKQFFPNVNIVNKTIVKEGDQLNLGNHVLNFINAPMVHWPEVILSYDSYSKVLFSADAFGSFSVVNKIDSIDYDDLEELKFEERRYYTNIVGKYGEQVQNVLKKAANLNIDIICPLHGPIHTKRINELIDCYQLWSTYQKEKEGILIVYTTIYGHSEKAALYLFETIKKTNVDVDIINLNKEDFSIALSKTFIYDKIILIAPTFNMGIFPKMREYLDVLIDHNIANKTFALIENGSWAPQAKKIMSNSIEKMKNCHIISTSLTIKSSLKESDYQILDNIIDELVCINNQNDKNNLQTHHWRCNICGYIYEGETIPNNYVCPLCGRPSSDFKKID